MKKTILLYFVCCSFINYAQIFHSNGGLIYINNGAELFCNGGVTLSNSTQLTNNGTLTATKNSTFLQPGDFEINTNSVVSGNGTYRVEQDWINNATFNGNNSEVVLFGNTEQFITSANGTVTTFNDLTLMGNGTNLNRRKILLNVDAATGNNGILNLNDRELSTNTNSFFVENTNPSAVLHTAAFNNEGFVSSLTDGFLVRNTNQQTDYLFPVGSSEGTRRYRPVTIHPHSTAEQTYEVRLNNFSADNDGYFLAQHEEIIDDANPLFFHSISRTQGVASADVKLFFIPSADNNWTSFAHWYPTAQEWKDVGNTTEANTANYNFLLKNNWDFPTNNDPYVLVNTIYPFSIPNVFTPNGDGINDLFFITASGLTEFNLIIVNRWGELMFETDDPNEGWDGTFNGNKCSEGVYFYSMKAKQSSNNISKHGHLTLSGN